MHRFRFTFTDHPHAVFIWARDGAAAFRTLAETYHLARGKVINGCQRIDPPPIATRYPRVQSQSPA